ncbi:MAG: sulfite oxidase-like oxidoreductase [Actinomycetia bacterium]|nr:sulfite oxidase-like oxidoreductase [Actinomycetes bacterium]
MATPQARDRIPPGQTVTRLFPVLHYGTVPRVDLARWRFRIHGLVEQPRVLTWEELRRLPHRTVTADIHCVTGWSKLGTTWEGVSTRDLLGTVRLRPEATHVMVEGANDYTTNLSLDDFLAPTSLFAWAFDGEPLLPEHGGPLRLVVPHLYFWKSAKWVTGIRLMDHDEPGFWEDRGYHMRGDPWREERYW